MRQLQKDYEDILDHEWLGSPDRPRMSLAVRAKIFMPFAALRGYEELLEKTRREHDGMKSSSQ